MRSHKFKIPVVQKFCAILKSYRVKTQEKFKTTSTNKYLTQQSKSEWTQIKELNAE